MAITQSTSSLGWETDKSFEKLNGEVSFMKKELEETANSAEEMVRIVKELSQKDLL